ncbi:hypothetical protein [Prescottella sp. R16]|uniref:hypothetical protein n=1 Tax=Prescottella sp. R16 TaxID=3064529 RepID=UPI00272E5184|nr:hypothetical protein [Prescottella sp. R16]
MTEQENVTAQKKLSRLWARIPHTLFRGHMRTTTAVMCVLWLGLSILNGELNPTPSPVTEAPAPAGTEQGTYIPPAPVEKPPTQPSTSVPASPSETSGTPTPSPSPQSGRSGSSSSSTTPGGQRETSTLESPGENGSTVTSETSQSEPGSVETTPQNETTVVPTPEG